LDINELKAWTVYQHVSVKYPKVSLIGETNKSIDAL